MNITGNLFLIVAGLATAIISIGLFRSILNSSRYGRMHREKLFERVKSLPLRRMLDAMGVDEQKYLFQSRLADVQTQIRRCEQCTAKQKCDEHLGQGEVNDAKRFCPNNEDLTRLGT